QRDDGILLLIAPNERRLRIEGGQGREGDLPDAYARRIIDDVITPFLRQGDYDRAVMAGVDAIVQRTDPDAYPLTGVAAPTRTYDVEPAKPKSALVTWIERIGIFVMIWFLLFTRVGRAILFSMLLSGGGRSRGRSGG